MQCSREKCAHAYVQWGVLCTTPESTSSFIRPNYLHRNWFVARPPVSHMHCAQGRKRLRTSFSGSSVSAIDASKCSHVSDLSQQQIQTWTTLVLLGLVVICSCLCFRHQPCPCQRQTEVDFSRSTSSPSSHDEVFRGVRTMVDDVNLCHFLLLVLWEVLDQYIRHRDFWMWATFGDLEQRKKVEDEVLVVLCGARDIARERWNEKTILGTQSVWPLVQGMSAMWCADKVCASVHAVWEVLLFTCSCWCCILPYWLTAFDHYNLHGCKNSVVSTACRQRVKTSTLISRFGKSVIQDHFLVEVCNAHMIQTTQERLCRALAHSPARRQSHHVVWPGTMPAKMITDTDRK